MDSNIGKKLDGRYEITELIGVGGMADVYKAVDTMENRVVAVKILKDEFSQNEEFLRRFRNESKAIAVLSHPNIVKIYDVGFTDEIQFIVMEYIDGITLKEFIEQQGVLRWKDALHFITQILRALQHAHDKGIVHRDIKPQNIMIFPDGTIKVMDFGIARFSRVDGKTLSDKTIGSVHYISPEQAGGEMTDERSDIYSVGIMLYEMLTGRKPFDGENPVAIALKHMQENAVAPREIMPSIPEALEEIVIHAMEREANKRYQSAAEMIKDIDTFKLNPSVIFGYKSGAPVGNMDDSTIFFKPVLNEDEYDDDNYDEDEYDEDEDEGDEDEAKRSYVIPILMAVTVVVVIVAAVIIAGVVIGNFSAPNTHTGTITIPNFVGKNITQVQQDYKDKLNFEISLENSNEYDEGIIMRQTDVDKTVREGYTVAVVVSKGQKLITVPDMSNKTSVVAMSELRNAGFNPVPREKRDDNVAEGLVIMTEPAAGEQHPDGADVLVYVSTGPVETEIKVPNLVGLTEEKAIAKLKENKLTCSIKELEHDGDKGKVIEQSIAAGQYVERKTEVIIYVSTGEVSPTKMEINVPLPDGVHGGYTFEVYYNGSVVATKAIAAAETTSSVNIEIEGKKTQVFTIYIRNEENNQSVKYATYDVDFKESEITLIGSLNESGLLGITPETATTTTTTTTTTPAPPPPLPDSSQDDSSSEESQT